MSKIITKTKHGETLMINRLTPPEAVSVGVNKVISSGEYPGFLPIEITQKGKKELLTVKVSELPTLSQHFGELVSREVFLDIAYKVALLIKACEKNNWNANNLDLNKDHMFVDPFTKSLKCIYWPVVNNQLSRPPYVFLKQLPYSLSFDPNEDRTYLEQYTEFFVACPPFSINAFEQFLGTLRDKRVMADTLSLSDTSRVNHNHNTDTSNHGIQDVIEYVPLSNADGESVPESTCDEDTEPCQTEKKPIVAKDINYGTVILKFNDHGAFIRRAKTGEIFEVNKPVFRIGKAQLQCDLPIRDNKFISHRHADIITKDKRYFLIDKSSTNKTYVENEEICPETKIEIFNGTKITLANEEFIFCVE